MVSANFLQHAKNVTLFTSYPPSQPHHLCDWRFYTAAGEVAEADLVKYSRWFDSLPGRIETVSISKNGGFRSLMIFLVTLSFVWGLCCRALMSGGASGGRRFTRMNWALGAGLIAVSAWDYKFKTCVAVLTLCVLVSEKGAIDGLAMLQVFVLVSNMKLVAALGFSVAYASWAALWLKARFREFCTLPDYEEFLAGLRPVDRTSKREHTGDADQDEDEDEDERGCMICWSPDVLLQQLPCKGKHQICMDCLNRLHEAARNRCPLCCLPLYSDRKCSRRIAHREIIVACLGATSAFNIIGIALKLYHGAYISAAFDVFVVLSIRRATWECLYPILFVDGTLMNDGFVALLLVVSLVVACWTGYWIGPWDQATFVNGERVRGLWIGMKYTFVWD